MQFENLFQICTYLTRVYIRIISGYLQIFKHGYHEINKIYRIMAIIQRLSDFQEKNQNYSNSLRFLKILKNAKIFKGFKTRKNSILNQIFTI